VVQPRWYQTDLIKQTRDAWESGAQNVIVVSPPRSGKTKMAVWLAEPFVQQGRFAAIVAHREELVTQIALEFAEHGIEHEVIAPSEVVASIIAKQIEQYGRRFVCRGSFMTVGSVQTIVARAKELPQWAARIELWITDEAHHCLTDNMWGKVLALFPQAHGLGFSATPARTDRKSLARSQGGVFDAMVKGVTARQLIDEGHICDYRIIAPPASIDRSAIKVGSTGDFTQAGLVDAKDHSTITGDAVASYLRYTPGEQAIVFAVDVRHADELCAAYSEAGVAAQSVSAKTPSAVRKAFMSKFERGVFQVLVNVDLFGEGLNVKGITVVVMCRPTQSFVLYVQQFFRALTKSDGKVLGTIIDHAGNVGWFGKIYGLPDSYNRWRLESDEGGRRAQRDPDVIPVTTCGNLPDCGRAYEAINPACPFCGFKPEPSERGRPDQVEGDLVELDLETLRALRGEAERIVGDPQVPQHLDSIAARGLVKKWNTRADTQVALRDTMAIWSGIGHGRGESDSVIQRRFFYRFGVDMGTAQTLNAVDAEALRVRIEETWND
jgi:superfamily II DNA or RNA helicase